MDKACPEHGQFGTLIWAGNEREYLRWLDFGCIDISTLPRTEEAVERALAGARPEELAERFRSGPLAQAAALGAARTQPDSGPLTEFERLCDNAVTGYLASASRVPFGEETVIGYLYAREAEITAVRIIMAGRMAGLDGETIRSRLRATYV